MYDTLRELHRKFWKELPVPKLEQQYDETFRELMRRLEKPERKLVLRLLDTRDLLAENAAFDSFACGLRLALDLTTELQQKLWPFFAQRRSIMKTKITSLAISAALLLTACGQKANDQIGVAPPPSTSAVQEETQPPQPFTDPTAVEQPPAATPASVQERPQEDGPQSEITPQVTQTPEPVIEPALTEDIPSVAVPAKTGYDGDSALTPAPESESEPTPVPEPAPEPAALADRQAAIDVANAYAVSQYGVTTDGSLTLDNSAYRFPAAVPVDASQETLEAKARDMVDFTFRQLMMQAGVDSIADAGFRCNVCIIEDGSSLLIYALYDG